jgi:endonuclease/exonuclease/phosphatase (EEP) superfamily protein YafD
MVSTLTVMTFNVGNGLAPPARIVNHLRESEADIVGLQELAAPQAAAIQESLGARYPHQVFVGSGFSGRGLLSRYPLREHVQLDFAADRPDLRAVAELGALALTIIVAHPLPPRVGTRGIVFNPGTVAQIELLGLAALAGAPAVLLGDFNLTARHPLYGSLTANGLVDAFLSAGTGSGATFPLRLGRTRRLDHRLSWIPLPPLARIDYIWHTQELTTVAAWVGAGAGSDHRSVLARLALPATSGQARSEP